MRRLRNHARQLGQVELLALIIIVILFAFFVSLGLFPKKEPPTTPDANANAGQCCNNIDCTPDSTQTISFESRPYDLLKSSIRLTEQANWIQDSGQRTPDERHIIINTSNEAHGCGGGVDDQVESDGGCAAITNDVLVYVCVNNCDVLSGDSEYDVYIRRGDPVPEVIRSCTTRIRNFQPGRRQTIVLPTNAPDEPYKDLQLKKFDIVTVLGTTPWLSPYCKPAIYLYPEEKTDVNVSIAPKGKLTLAIPNYPKEGWNVTAFPDGQIAGQNTTYDYLYYEAEIADTLIEKPKEGFVVEYAHLAALFSDLLPKLGLNNKESSQFSEYWLKALPKLPYYFVGIVPTSNLNVIAPLTINPPPATTIRVTLYFQALDTIGNVVVPVISPVKRDGFTVVEWGGIVKTDPSHPFSCLM